MSNVKNEVERINFLLEELRNETKRRIFCKPK